MQRKHHFATVILSKEIKSVQLFYNKEKVLFQEGYKELAGLQKYNEEVGLEEKKSGNEKRDKERRRKK